MNSLFRKTLAAAVLFAVQQQAGQAQGLTDAIASGGFEGSLNMRYENVDQANFPERAKALTLRSAFRYTTGGIGYFSALLEAEDVRVLGGLDEYSVGPTGFNPGLYPAVADPESTEINQGYLQFAAGGFVARLGRQDLRYDNQRFIGAVPWRQDYQNFDALTLEYKPLEALSLEYNYLAQRNRIFADAADVDSRDHLLHADLATPAGTLAAYAYLLEEDTPQANGLDTYGLRFSGSRPAGDLTLGWLAEAATQEATRGGNAFDARYFVLEGAVTAAGYTARLGYESLGSDGGAYGFATPLATLHAFQGWADMFLSTPDQGIDDLYLSLSGKLFGGTWTAVYHDFEAHDSAPGVKSLGDEIDLQWIRPIGAHYILGIKYAAYDQGDLATRPDTDKLWAWFQVTF